MGTGGIWKTIKLAFKPAYLPFYELIVLVFTAIATITLATTANSLSSDSAQAARAAASSAEISNKIQATQNERAARPLFDFRYTFGSPGQLELRNIGPGVGAITDICIAYLVGPLLPPPKVGECKNLRYATPTATGWRRIRDATSRTLYQLQENCGMTAIGLYQEQKIGPNEPATILRIEKGKGAPDRQMKSWALRLFIEVEYKSPINEDSKPQISTFKYSFPYSEGSNPTDANAHCGKKNFTNLNE